MKCIHCGKPYVFGPEFWKDSELTELRSRVQELEAELAKAKQDGQELCSEFALVMSRDAGDPNTYIYRAEKAEARLARAEGLLRALMWHPSSRGSNYVECACCGAWDYVTILPDRRTHIVDCKLATFLGEKEG